MNEAVSRELLERRIADAIGEIPPPTNGLPTGGTAGQPLVKTSATDYAATFTELTNTGIAAAAGIQLSKLEAVTAGSVVLGNGSNVPTATALTGDVTVNSSGVTSIGAGVVVNADVSASAGINLSKLEAVTAGRVVLGNGSNVATATALTGDVTVNSSGVTAIGSGVIVDGDISASAGIALSKLEAVTAGRVVLGNATNVATATALTGDVTVNSSGVTAIAAGAVIAADLNTAAGELAGTWNSATIVTRGNISGVQAATIWTYRVGKTYTFQLSMPTGNTATGAGAITFTLPGSVTAARNQVLTGRTSSNVGLCTITGGVITLQATAAGANFTAGQALGTVNIAGTIEIT